MSSPWRLLVSDLDGTLTLGTTALDHLRTWIGHDATIDGLEERFVRGEVTDRDVADGYAPHYRGLALADAAEAMTRIPAVDDIAAGVAVLRERSVDAVVATVSWGFAARAVADLWGFTDADGAELEVVDGRFTGRVARHFAPEDKVTYVAEHCRRAGIGMHEVVAVGDGRSDLPLFAAVGFAVAFNASPAARAAASTTVDSRSFLDALHAVPGLLSQPAASSRGSSAAGTTRRPRANLTRMENESDQPVPEKPATWENVVVGKAKEALGRAIGDHDLAEEGAEQEEVAHEVREEFQDEQD